MTSVPEPLKSGSATLFKRRIATELRQRRKDAGVTQQEAAQRLDRSQAHIANIESKARLPSRGDLELLLQLYGVPDRIPFMCELLSAAKKQRSWWTAFSGAVPDWFDLYLGLETGAGEINTFESYLVPGLLQTRAYAEAVVRGDPDHTAEDVRRIVDVRLERQQHILSQPEPPRLWAVIDELVLYRPRGEPAVMAEQIDHLIAMAQQPRVDIQILPRDAGAHIAQLGGSFSLLKFPSDWVGDPGLVYEEALPGGRYHEDPAVIALYSRALTRLQALAAKPADSDALLQQARKEVAT